MMNREPKSPIAEAYRTLRTNIQFSSIDKKIKTIVVTSSGATEGKSTTAANVAASFAQMGKKVLIIDADLRKPRQHKMFDISNKSGLTNVLFDSKSYNDYIKKVDDIYVLTSGPIPPNPAEILGSSKMHKLIEQLKDHYEYIIIDTPPVSYVTDGAIMSSYSDGTLLVVATGQTDSRAAIAAKEQLDNVSANILGVVITKLPLKAKGYYKYHYANAYAYQEDK